MLDMTESIAPKSDQLNAEDMLTGPRTVTIREVRAHAAYTDDGNAQPFDFYLEEVSRPFRPSKTVRRILVAAWGKDAAAYAGRRMTLYRDPDVKFGGQDVGGIRVSHLSHIDRPLKLALTVTRGKRATHVVNPLPDEVPPTAPVPEYMVQARAAKTLDEVKAIWGAASAAGHLTEALAAELKAIGDALQPDQPALDDDPRDQS